jgi:lambda family phage minor tail protein L
MTILSDIQQLEPGAWVQLFELDATSLGADRLFFHGYTQIGSIWWQGTEYSPWPIDAEGFELNPDQPPTPTLSAGNVDGRMTALCLAYQDLVGAKLIRHRTLGKYLDVANSPVSNVVQQSFIPSGTTFQIGGPAGQTAGVNVSAIHRTDWQGRTALSGMPRTNSVRNSATLVGSSLSNVTLTMGTDGAPDGSANYAIITSMATAAPQIAVATNTSNIIVDQDGACSFRARIRDSGSGFVCFQCNQQDASNTVLAASAINFDLIHGVWGSEFAVGSFGLNGFASLSAVKLNGWWHLAYKFTPKATATRAQPYIGQASSLTSRGGAVGAKLHIFGVQNCPGVYIPTGTANVTVTDYTVTAVGAGALGQAATAAMAFDWDGSFQNNPTADPTQEMPLDIWFLERRSAETSEVLTWELSSALDFNGRQIPARQIIANSCAWLTRGGYRGPYCGYNGPPVATVDDTPTTDPALDRCSGKLKGCRFRFGQNGELPYGSFPAASLIK